MKNSKSFLVCSVYRPPSAKAEWIENFSKQTDKWLTAFDENYIMGDINIDAKNGLITTSTWKHVTELNDLQQLVTTCTRITAHSETLIDHVYASCPQHIAEVFVPCFAISDQNPVCFTRHASKNQIKRSSHKSITYRCYKRFNNESFLIELGDSLGQLDTISSDVNEHFSAWNKVFLSILDKHAPIKTKRVKWIHNPNGSVIV